MRANVVIFTHSQWGLSPETKLFEHCRFVSVRWDTDPHRPTPLPPMVAAALDITTPSHHPSLPFMGVATADTPSSFTNELCGRVPNQLGRVMYVTGTLELDNPLMSFFFVTNPDNGDGLGTFYYATCANDETGERKVYFPLRTTYKALVCMLPMIEMGELDFSQVPEDLGEDGIYNE
ncbi:hypothetical protein H4R33_000179 [Dimargaris cristalligena]|nr:hypothetical protein H4R33_000179 [Dimargaris cristalligena]